MKITYYTRWFTSPTRCYDVEHEAVVDKLAFQQGELYYFKQGRYGYLVLHKGERDGKWYA